MFFVSIHDSLSVVVKNVRKLSKNTTLLDYFILLDNMRNKERANPDRRISYELPPPYTESEMYEMKRK